MRPWSSSNMWSMKAPIDTVPLSSRTVMPSVLLLRVAYHCSRLLLLSRPRMLRLRPLKLKVLRLTALKLKLLSSVGAAAGVGSAAMHCIQSARAELLYRVA